MKVDYLIMIRRKPDPDSRSNLPWVHPSLMYVKDQPRLTELPKDKRPARIKELLRTHPVTLDEKYTLHRTEWVAARPNPRVGAQERNFEGNDWSGELRLPDAVFEHRSESPAPADAATLADEEASYGAE